MNFASVLKHTHTMNNNKDCRVGLVDNPPPLTEKIHWTEFEPFPKVQPGVKTEEAWALPEKGHTTITSATVLGAIGEFNVPFICCSTWST